MSTKPVAVNAEFLPVSKKAGRFTEPYGMLLSPGEGSHLELAFLSATQVLRPAHYSTIQRQWRFDLNRQWKFDFAWPKSQVAVEIEGGIFSRGSAAKGHGGGAAYEKNAEKYNHACNQGWKLFRLTPNMLTDQDVYYWIEMITAHVHLPDETGEQIGKTKKSRASLLY